MAVTDTQKTAAGNLVKIAGANAQAIIDEFNRARARYDQTDEQNIAAARAQSTQASQKAAGERFGANRKLQTSTQGVLAAAGNALQGSNLGAVGDMLRIRTDMDTADVYDTLRGNRNAIYNDLMASMTANMNARNEAASKAQTALKGIETDTAAQLNNIDPSLYAEPGQVGNANFTATGFADRNQSFLQSLPADLAQFLSGYIRPGKVAPPAVGGGGAVIKPTPETPVQTVPIAPIYTPPSSPTPPAPGSSGPISIPWKKPRY